MESEEIISVLKVSCRVIRAERYFLNFLIKRRKSRKMFFNLTSVFYYEGIFYYSRPERV